MSRWFRHYAGMMRDEKFVSAAVRSKQAVERVIWVWGAILESAAEINDGGKYNLDAAEVAYFLRADEADILGILDSLTQLDRIHDGVVAKWGDRQYQSDRSTDRVRAHRERGKADSNDGNEAGGVTADGCNSDVTAVKRSCNAPETETETETEKKEPPSLRDDWPEDFRELFWAEVPRKIGKQGAIRVLERVRKRGLVPWAKLISAIKAYAATADPAFTKHPETWLSKGCWDDELQKKPEEAAPDWDQLIGFYRKTGVWSRHIGPEPGMSGCRAPPELLQKHGIAA